MRRIALVEYRTSRPVYLSVDDRDLLRQVAPDITITPTTGTENHYELTPGSIIGAISLPELAIEIRPKIQKLERVLFLMSYALDPKSWKETGFNFGETEHIHEAIIPGFVSHVRRAFRRGVLQGYRREEASLPTIRGRIRFDDQIRDRYGIAPPVEVRYDDFTEDIELNRLIKAAIARVQRLRYRNPQPRSQLRAFRGSLERVQLVEYNPTKLPQITYNRLNDHYRPAVELAELILKSISFELTHGKTRATAFLVDMNKVFENFVVVALREALGLSQVSFPQNAHGKELALDQAGDVHLKPDISWWVGNRCKFVGDVKYKKLAAAGIKHPDLYQLLSYLVATNLPWGVLIYAEGEEKPARHEVVHLTKRLDVVSINLAGSPQQILKQIEAIANSIKRKMTEPSRFVA